MTGVRQIDTSFTWEAPEVQEVVVVIENTSWSYCLNFSLCKKLARHISCAKILYELYPEDV